MNTFEKIDMCRRRDDEGEQTRGVYGEAGWVPLSVMVVRNPVDRMACEMVEECWRKLF